MEQFYLVIKRAFLPILLLLIGFSSLFGQTVTINTSKHTTTPQNEIIVNFTGAGGATGLAGTGTGPQQIALWTVRIDPDGAGALPSVIVPVTGITVLGFNVIVAFDASGVTGHAAAEKFIKPGETMTVQYAGGTGAGAISVTGGGNFVPAVPARPSINDSLFNCGLDLLVFKKEVYGTVDQCIPVTMNFTQYCYRMSLRFRNSSNFNLSLIFFSLDWGDGSGIQNPNPYISDAAGLPSPNFIEPTSFTGSAPDVVLTLRPTHPYPSTTTPNNTTGICSWDFSVTPYINGACSSIAISDVFANYDTDNANSGALSMPFNPPGVGETTDRVCLGTNVNMRYNDLTQLNCRLAAPESFTPNQATRAVRIVYGSTNAPAPGNIPDVRVTVPAVLGGGTTILTSNVLGGGVRLPAGNVAAGIPVGAFAPTNVGSADANGVITIPPNVLTSTALQFMGQIFTASPANQALNQRYYVRMDYWDVCNPYNALSPTLPAPVSIEGYIEIITKPAALTTAGLTVCYNTANPATNFTVTGVVGGVTAIKFYNRNPKGVLPFQVMQSSLSANFSTANYTAGNGAVGAPYRTNTVGGAYFSVWATQTIGGNACESDPVEVVIYQQPDITPNLPAAPTGSASVCNGTTATYNEANTPPDKTTAINTFTNGTAITLVTEDLWSVSGFPAGVGPPSPLTTDKLSAPNSSDVGFAIVAPATSVTGQVNVRLRYKTTQSITVKSPLAAPFTLPDYNIAAQACQTANVSLNVTVFGQTLGGNVTNNQTICNSGVAFANLTLAGHRGQIVRWERTYNAGAPQIIAATAGLTTFSEIPPNGAGTYTYYAVVQNQSGGPCAVVSSGSATITVNPIPVKPTISQDVTSDGLSICANGSDKTVLRSSTDVNGPTYLWFRNGVSTGVSTPTITLTTVAQSGSYTVRLFGIAPTNCPGPISDPVVVTVNPLPSATVSGGGSVCSGNPAPDVVWVLTGTQPFTLSYTDGATTFGPFVVAAGTFTVPSPTVQGNYQLTSLADVSTCGATSLGGSVPVTIQAVPPPTVQSFTATAAVCDVGGGTNPPDALLDLSPDAVANYSITYHLVRLSGGPGAVGADITGPPLASSATGLVTLTPTYVQMGGGADALGYQIVITSIFNTTTLCAGAVPINGPTLIINPTPAPPAGPVGSIACSLGTGQPISVTAPPVGNTIVWSTTSPAFTNAVPGSGAVSGTRDNTFTPATSATQTFFAFTLSGIGPTNCRSATGVAVTQTQDINPTNVNAGLPGSTCTSSYTLTGATPVNGTGTWSAPGTISFVTPGSPTSVVNNLPIGVSTLTWTVKSTLNVCTPIPVTVDITRNPLPAAIDPLPQLCEAVPLGGSVPNVNLPTTYNDLVTGIVGSTDRSVAYFSDIARTINVTAIPQTITNGKIFYTTVTTVSTTCKQNGTITFQVNSSPVANNQTPSFCEDLPIGSNQHAGVDLTAINNSITGGAANRTVTWFSDAALTTLVPTPNNYLLVGNKTLFAKVLNTVSLCTNTATISLTTKPRPLDNPIGGSGTVCRDKSTIVLYQVDPTKNPGSSFTWNVTAIDSLGNPSIAPFQVFGGGGVNSANFFILLTFPHTGTVHITVFETLSTCTGNTSSLDVTVAGAPGAIAINGPTAVCSNVTGVVYSIPAPNPTSVYTWTVTGATVAGPSSGVGLSSIPVDYGIISPVNIQVKETSTSGCVGAPASINVLLSPKPSMTSSSTSTVCSGSTPGLVFTSSVASTFSWKVTNITGAVTGTSVGNTGNGDLSATFTGAAAIKNTTGAVGSVAFDVTPTATAAPNCQGPVQAVVLTINPEPVLVSAQSKTICSGTAVNYEILLTPAGLPAGTVFNWPAPVMSNASIQGSSGTNVPASLGGLPHLTDVLINTSTTAITATYTITPTSSLTGCLGAAKTVVITINPEPVMVASLNATKCSDEPIGLTFATIAGSVAANNYNIISRTIDPGLTAGATNALVANGVSSNYLANDTYNNITSAFHTVSYTVAPVSATGCVGAPKIITITVNPEPVLSNLLDATVCSDAAIGVTLNTNGSSVGAASYNITRSALPPGLSFNPLNAFLPANGKAANYLINDKFTNQTSAPLTIVYSVTPVSSDNCLGSPPVPVTVTILPEPVVSPSLSTSVCSGAAIGLTLNTNGSSVAAFNYDITSQTIAPGLVANPANALPANGVGPGYLSANKFTNTGTASLLVTYTVVPRSPVVGCLGDATIVTITINPEPVMSNTLDNTVCSDLPISLILNTNGTSVGAVSYNITSRSVSGGLTANSGNVLPTNGVAANYLANDIYTNTGPSPLTVTYTVVPVSSSGCLGAQKVITITVNPEPVIATGLDGTFCSEVVTGLTLNTNGTSVAAATYNVTSIVVAAGLTANGTNAGTNVGVAANYLANDIFFNLGGVPRTVTYTVVPVSAVGCVGDPKVITLTISPEPIMSTTLDATRCSGIVTGLILNTNGTSVAAATYDINTIDVPAGLIGAGTNVTAANGVLLTYLQNDKFTNTGPSPLTVRYNVTPRSASNCPGPIKDIFITINPEPVVSTTLDASNCSDVATGLVLATNGTSVAAATYNITNRTVGAGLTPVGTAAVPANGVLANYLAADVFTNTTASPITVAYTVVPISAATCLGASKVITLTINPEPVIATNLNATVCSHLPIGLTLNTNGTSVAAASYNVVSRTVAPGLVPDGANAAIASGVVAGYLVNDKFTNTGTLPLTVTYTVLPMSGASCVGDSKVITITINPEPVVSITLDATVCSDASIGLTLATDGISVAAANYNITAQSISPGLTHPVTNATVPAVGVGTSYLNADKYNNVTATPLTVSYTVVPVSAAGCQGAPQLITMTISPEPVLSGSLNLTVCSDLPTALSLNTNGTSVAAQNYNITNLSLAPGLTAVLGNAVVPASGVNLGYLGNDKFTNTGAVSLTASYTVVPVSAAGCAGDPLVVVITVNPKPVVSATLNATICSGLAIGLTLNTNGTSVAAANYNIAIVSVPGALTPGANAAVPSTAVTPGYLANDTYVNTTASPLDVTYTVVPVSAIGCLGDLRVITITISPEPVVANGLDGTVCSDVAVALTLNTNGSSVGAASYNVTRTVNPALTSAGANPASPATGVAANYFAADKFTNTGALPANVVYQVVPVSGTGCLGAMKTITIIINPEPVVASGLDAFICSDLPVNLTLNTNGTSVAAVSYNIVSRTVAVGLVANGANVAVPAPAVPANYLLSDAFTNTTASSLTVTYVVAPVSGAGCIGDPKTIVMTIRPEPVVSSGLDGTKCSGLATGLILATNGSSVAAANYNVTVINAAAGLTAAGANAVTANGVAANYLAGDIFTNTGPLPLNVVYTVVPVSGTGCLGDAKNITFIINPQPVISATLDATVCSDIATGLTLNTNGISVGAASYNLTSIVVAPALTAAPGNALPANGVAANYLVNDKFTNTTNADATVVYNVVALSAAGCTGASQAITITIRPEPVLAGTLNKTVCSDAPGGIALNTNGTSIAAATYNITAVTVPAGLAIISQAVIPATGVAANYLATDTYTNPGNASLDVLYTVVPVSAAGCLGDALVVKQTVTPEPVLGNLNKAVCSDAAIGLTLNTSATSVIAATYNVTLVNIPAGLTAAATNVGIPGNGVAAGYLFNDQYTNHGNLPLNVQYTVVPISGIGCLGDPAVVVITVNPEPVVSNALNKTVCSDIVSGITLNTDGVSVAAASYNITSIVRQGGLTPAAGNVATGSGGAAYIAGDVFTNKTSGSLTVTYTVMPVSAGGCLGDALDIVLTVDPEPVMDPLLGTKTVCSRDITNVTLNTNGSSVAAATYNISLVSQDAGLTGAPTVGNGLTATAIVNDNFINVTTIPLKVIYQIIPVSAGGCLGDPFNITLTINAEPVINPALDNTVCSREAAGIVLSTNGTSVAANSYQLVSVTVPGTITADPANTVPGTASGINLIKNDKYTNTTAAAVVVTYSVFGISPQNCQGQPQNILLTINPEPILSPGTANLCSDVPSGIILAPAPGSAPITQFTLKSIVKAPALIAGSSNAGLGTYNTNNFLAADQFTNTTNGPLIVTYTLAPIAAGCVGTDQTVVFTVNPAPGVAGNLNKTVCTGDASGIVFATETSPLSTPAASYNIVSVTIAAGLTQTAGNTGARAGITANEVQNDRFSNPSNGILTVTYRVTALSGSGCLGPAKDIVLTVEPTIKATPLNNKPNICSNDLTDIDLISPTIPTSGGITFNYTAVSSVGGLISGFVPVASNLPANTKITDNLVNNSPNPATVTYSVTAVANGAKGGSGCIGLPVPVIVTVEPKPKLVATPLIRTVCEGAPVAIALSTTTVPSAGTMHFNIISTVADPGLALTSAAPPAFYLNGQSITDTWSNSSTGVLTVTYTLAPVVSGGLGCVGDNVTITVNVNPSPTLTNSPQAPICSNDFVNITLTSDVANTINTWTAVVIAPGTVTGAGPGAGDLIFQTLKNTGTIPATVRYTVTPKANNCVGTPLDIDVVVNPLADVAAALPPQKVCFGGTLNVPLSSSVAGTTFSWEVTPFPNSMSVPQFGSGNTITQVLSNPTGAQDFLTYTITATGPGATACASQPKTLTVIAAPEMNAAILNPATWLCKGSKDFLQIQLDGQAPFEMVYTDGTSNFTLTNVGNFKSIQIQPTATTTYTLVSMKDAFNCPLPLNGSVTFTVGETDATFSVFSPASSCSPYQVTLEYDQKAGTEYTWRWGDGVEDSVYIAAADVNDVHIVHTYTNASPTSTFKPKISLQTDLPAPFPGCFKTSTQTINVFPTIVTNVFPDKTEICSGDLIRFSNQSFGVTVHKWFYREAGNVGQELDIQSTKNASFTIHNTTATNPMMYEVVYQATNGNCPADDVITPITVYREIALAEFDEGTIPDLDGSGHSIATFTNTSVPIDPAQFLYEWDFGQDASPATATGPGPIQVDFSSPGPRDVVLTITNIAADAAGLSCGAQFSKNVLVPVKQPVAAFVAIPPVSCYPATITVTENNSENADVFEWRLIDNNGKLSATSNAPLPAFQMNAPGKYSLSLKVTNSFTGQVAVAPVQTFTVFDRPLASFEVRPDIVYVPDTEMTTFNFSFGASDYLWDFGDNETSTEFQPIHIYKIEGKYDVTLIAKEDHGDGVVCADTLSRVVIAKQGGLTKVPNAFTPNPNGPNSGSSNGSFNDVFLPIVKGVEEFNMQIYDRWGNLLFESNSASIGWDGYNKDGKLMPSGVYVYKLTVRLSDNQRSTQIGDVTMIR